MLAVVDPKASLILYNTTVARMPLSAIADNARYFISTDRVESQYAWCHAYCDSTYESYTFFLENAMHTFGYRYKHYSVESLWEFVKNKPVQTITTPVHLFEKMLVDKCWGKLVYKNDKWVTSELTMAQMVHHVRKILNADTSYPIICLISDPCCMEGRILDGLHRVAKNILQNEPKTKAIVLTVADIDTFVAEHKPAKESVLATTEKYSSCTSCHCSI